MDPRPAPLWRLAAAALADAVLGVIAWSLAAMWLLLAVRALRARPLDALDSLVLALAVLLLGVAFHVVYHTVLVGGCGQTFGKMLLGVTVVRRDGAPAGYGRALLRVLGAGLCLLTLGLGRLLMLGRRDRRGLHDLVAGTRSVSVPRSVAAPGGSPLEPAPLAIPLETIPS
jgi:uncharacterized RDD family membrane protein YckC